MMSNNIHMSFYQLLAQTHLCTDMLRALNPTKFRNLRDKKDNLVQQKI